MENTSNGSNGKPDIAPDPSFKTRRAVFHALLDVLPMRPTLAVIRKQRDIHRRRHGMRNAQVPAERKDRHPPVMRAAVEALGGYDRIKRGLDDVYAARFAVRAAAVIYGQRWFDKAVAISGALPPEGSIVAIPHIGAPFLHQAHFLVRGHKVFCPAYDPTGTKFGGQWRQIARFGRIPASARLRLVNLPDPLFAVRAKRALDDGFTFTWQPDTFVTYRQRRNLTPIRFLGLDLAVTPLVERLARETRAPLYLAFNRVSWGGAAVRAFYERLDYRDEPEGELTRRLFAATERAILANLDQWCQWDPYPDFGQ